VIRDGGTPFGLAEVLLAFAVGACVGSFAGVVAYRLPREISIIKPRSFCPRCQRPLSNWANIPIVSYIVLRGRCRRCGAAIGFRYFLAEFGLAAAAAWLILSFPLGDAIARFALCAILFVIGLIDYDWGVIYHATTLAVIPLGVVAGAVLMPEVGWRSSLMGVVAGAGLMYSIGLVYRLSRGREGVALGDVYLIGMAGAFLGWPGALFTLFVGSLLGSIGGLAIAATGWSLPDERIPEAIAAVTGARRSGSVVEQDLPLLGTPIPFGPFLALAAAIYALFQPQLAHWYFSG
jgi:leader peptidase (prepilin peptidase) / N-methyltransferase